ncbi:hypothetical protein RB195_022836 [Necator americanus]|uniref:Uncharacterized protein n=1 Tax=Necator americanus TaxID=51031 RepID=A0ABR1EH15_NECAM
MSGMPASTLRSLCRETVLLLRGCSLDASQAGPIVSHSVKSVEKIRNIEMPEFDLWVELEEPIRSVKFHR